MSDAKIGDMGLLAMLASGPILGGKMGEAEHTFCEDCERFDSPGPDPGPGCVRIGRCACDDHVYEATGPLWPGCRGFKLRPGALGPMKRYAKAVRDKTNAALEGEKP